MSEVETRSDDCLFGDSARLGSGELFGGCPNSQFWGGRARRSPPKIRAKHNRKKAKAKRKKAK